MEICSQKAVEHADHVARAATPLLLLLLQHLLLKLLMWSFLLCLQRHKHSKQSSMAAVILLPTFGTEVHVTMLATSM